MPLVGKTMPPGPSAINLPRRQRELLDQVRGLTRLSSQRGAVSMPGGPQLAPNGTIFRLGLTPEQGIPAQGALQDNPKPPPDKIGTLIGAKDCMDVTITVSSPTLGKLQLWEDNKFPAFNPTSTPVPGGIVCVFALVLGQWMPILSGAGAVRAIAKTTIERCQGTDPGTGTATKWLADSNGNMKADNDVEVMNWFSATIPAGKHVLLVAVENGWEIASADC